MRRYGFLVFFAGSLFGVVGRYYANAWGGSAGRLVFGELWTVVGVIGIVYTLWRSEDPIEPATHKSVCNDGHTEHDNPRRPEPNPRPPKRVRCHHPLYRRTGRI